MIRKMRFFEIIDQLVCKAFKLSLATDQEDGCRFLISPFDFVSWKTEGHLFFSLSNQVFSEDDVICETVTEIIIIKRKITALA